MLVASNLPSPTALPTANGMELILRHATPMVVSRTVVHGVSCAAYRSCEALYLAIRSRPTSTELELEARLAALHVKTDLELIGAILSDTNGNNASGSKSLAVCYDHLHQALNALNEALSGLEGAVRGHPRYMVWTRGPSSAEIEEAMETVVARKRALDHHLERMVLASQIVAGGFGSSCGGAKGLPPTIDGR